MKNTTKSLFLKLKLFMFGTAIVLFCNSALSFTICIDPGHGFNNPRGWGNHGPGFNVNGRQYFTLKQPKNNPSVVTEISNSIEIPDIEQKYWTTLLPPDQGGKNIGLLEYQNNWKIATYLAEILENRNHTVYLTKGEHNNPGFADRAKVALDNECDFMISIHTNAPGNGSYSLGLFYAKSHFRVDYYRGTPPPSPAPSDTDPALWLDENKVCKQAINDPTPLSIPYVVGNNTQDQPVWLLINAVKSNNTPKVPFDPQMVRYKIDHQGSSWEETQWMPAGDSAIDYIISHRQNSSNVWAVAARYVVHDQSTPTPEARDNNYQRQTPTPLYLDGESNVALRGPHQSDTSENIATKIMTAIGNDPVLSASGYLNSQGANADWQWSNIHYDILVKCSKWNEPNAEDRNEIPVIIVECGFHTNADYEKWLYNNGCDSRYWQIAKAIADGIASLEDSDFENQPGSGPHQQYANLETTPVPGDKFYIDTQTLHVYSEYDDSCGESWGSPCAPFKTINDALIAAWDGVTIKVARGTYEEQISISGSDQNFTLLGGFDPVTWERDVIGNSTVIELNSADPLVFLGNETQTVVDGFEIRGYYNALNIDNAQPVLRNNTVSSSSGHGVSIDNCNTGSVVFEDNIFKDCLSSGRAGIRVNNTDNLLISKNKFVNSEFGIGCVGGSDPDIHHNEFEACDTGLYIYQVYPDIWGNTFISNSSGISVDGFYDAGAIIRNNIFLGNSNVGIYVDAAEIDIINNTFDSNFWGILYDVPYSSMYEGTVQNCIFSDNTHSGICALNDAWQWPNLDSCNFWQNGSDNTCDVSIAISSECYEVSSGFGCFKANPQFSTGRYGDYYLTQSGNQCVDGGNIPASGLYPDGYTTDPAEQQDIATIDLGLHYPIPTASPRATLTATPSPSPTITATPTQTPTAEDTQGPEIPPTCPPTPTNQPAGSAFIWPDSNDYYSLVAEANISVDDSSYYSPTVYLNTPTPVVLSVHVISTEDATGFDMDVSEIVSGTGLFDTSNAGTNLGFINGVSDPVLKLISVIDGSVVTVSYEDDDPSGTISDTFVWHEATWTPSPTPEFTETPTATITATPENTVTPTATPSPISWVVSDGYGYQGERIPCEWTDASDGTPIAVSGDDEFSSISIPFEFYYYDQFYPLGSTLTIGSNGLIGFSNSHIISSANQDIPHQDAPNGVICPFWDDLFLSEGAVVYTKTDGSAPDRRLIIEWANSSHYDNLSDDYTFELILFEGTSNIEFHYNSMDGEFADGHSASVGIEDHSGEQGIQFSSTGTSGYVYDCLSMRFTYPGTPTPSPTVTSTPSPTPTFAPLPTLSKTGISLLLIFMGIFMLVFASGLSRRQ